MLFLPNLWQIDSGAMEEWLFSTAYPSPESQERMEETRERIWAEYGFRHANCPQCRNGLVSRSRVGYSYPPDLNVAWCQCGWRGTVNDLIQAVLN